MELHLVSKCYHLDTILYNMLHGILLARYNILHKISIVTSTIRAIVLSVQGEDT